MLTKLKIRNFKNLKDAEIELGQMTVFAGPNNSGKTSALQALTLWERGAKSWLERRSGSNKRSAQSNTQQGITLNRRDLVFLPVPASKLLWHGQHIKDNDIEIEVEGFDGNENWNFGLRFYRPTQETIYCQPQKDGQGNVMEVPGGLEKMKISLLPPMSGLASNETSLEPGAINVRLGEGRTSEVLRNLCKVAHESNGETGQWDQLVGHVQKLFGVELLAPQYIPNRGEITMEYKDSSGVKLDLSCCGRGQQQAMLLLAHMITNPGDIILLDEPDAHLEILRQRETYDLLSETAFTTSSQLIIASHSEIFVHEAAEKSVLISFVGRPHRVDNKSQTLKALREYGFEHYLNAEKTGWVLYLEGSTDLSILRQLARKLSHPVADHLQRPFLHPVGNKPTNASKHFHALKEAKSDLVGIAIFDRDAKLSEQDSGTGLIFDQWEQREIENYLCSKNALIKFAEQIWVELTLGATANGNRLPIGDYWANTMSEVIEELEQALAVMNIETWGPDIKASDDFLAPLFKNFFEKMGHPNIMLKTNFHRIAECMEPQDIDPEITAKLDLIAQVAEQANPAA